VKAVNEFFFGEERIHISDAIWFYGTIVTITVVGLIVVL